MEISQAASVATTAIARRLRAGEGFDDLVGGRSTDLGGWAAQALNTSAAGRAALRSLAQVPDGRVQMAAVTTQLTVKANTDPQFATELIRKAAPRSVGSTQMASTSDGGMAMNVGSGASVTAKGPIVGRDYRSTINNKKVNHGARYLVAAIVAILFALFLIKAVPAVIHTGESLSNGDKITADSTCHEFLDADEATEQQALVDIAMAKGIGGFGSPLALPEIRYECSGTPNMKIGDVVTRDAHEF